MTEVDQGVGAKDPARPWYAEDGWLRARIDMNDFGLGTVHIVDSKGSFMEEWRRALQQDSVSIEQQAKLFAAYVDKCDDPGMPKPRSTWKQWETWIRGAHNKAITRLYQGIIHFSDRMPKVEADTPN